MLALAITDEGEDGRIHADFAHALRGEHPGSARLLDGMAAEEGGRRRQLIDASLGRWPTTGRCRGAAPRRCAASSAG